MVYEGKKGRWYNNNIIYYKNEKKTRLNDSVTALWSII